MTSAPPVSERRVAASTITLSVRRRAGGKPPVLCLHGLASNARWWDLVGLRLAPDHEVVAPDLRGHGRSDRPEAGYGFEEVTVDLQALLDALELPPAVVVGHSWGASVALALAAAEPVRVVGCVLVDGGVGDLRRVFGETWALAEAAMTPPEFPAATAADLPRLLARSPLAEGSDPATAAAILQGNLEEDSDGRLRARLDRRRHLLIARSLFELNGPALLGATGQPILMLPARDPSRPPWQADKAEAVASASALLGPRGRVRWIDGAHDLPLQRPVQVAEAIREFVEELRAPGSGA